MAQQDFERFKKEIKDWLDSHPKEYDTFVAEVMINQLQAYTRYTNWGANSPHR